MKALTKINWKDLGWKLVRSVIVGVVFCVLYYSTMFLISCEGACSHYNKTYAIGLPDGHELVVRGRNCRMDTHEEFAVVKCFDQDCQITEKVAEATYLMLLEDE